MKMDINLKEQIINFTGKMVDRGLTTGTGGNISIINRPKGQVHITPSGIDYELMTATDISTCDLKGQLIHAGKKPSSELDLHLAIYEKRQDIGAIIHTHSVYATTLACLHKPIPAVHYLVGYSGDKVPLTAYATFGTPELAQSVSQALKDHNAALLANHGLVTVGDDIEQAFNVSEQIEFVARIYYQTLTVGSPKMLTKKQMETVLEKFESYGKQKLL
ncbi:MAG: L-fuculose-phosphate aldolase [Desulfobacteraceae bacterium]|nr:L-fuculose-phosphate aldolase [Desulfobacteraceae bacterium]